LNCIQPEVRRTIADLGYDDLAAEIERLHTRLLHARVKRISTSAAKTEIQLQTIHCFVLWQVHLHRAERLMVSCGLAVGNNDPYGLATLIRGFVETTAALGAIRAALESVAIGTLTIEAFSERITTALVGTRVEGAKDQPKAINVLNFIEKTDKFLATHAGRDWERSLASMYEDLSDYAHPNIGSNLIAFDLQKDRYIFQHGNGIRKAQVSLLKHLKLAAQIFDWISDSFQALSRAN
jgi:hypothetical protein